MTALDYYFETPDLYNTARLQENRETIERLIREGGQSISLVELSRKVREHGIDILLLDAVMKSLHDEGRVEITPEFLVIPLAL